MNFVHFWGAYCLQYIFILDDCSVPVGEELLPSSIKSHYGRVFRIMLRELNIFQVKHVFKFYLLIFEHS